MASGLVRVRAFIDIDYVPAGVGATLLGQSQANNPGYGQGAGSGTAGFAQTMRLQVSEAVVGTPGSLTLAQIKTATDAISVDIAGATGTPLITAALLTQINNWATGSP